MALEVLKEWICCTRTRNKMKAQRGEIRQMVKKFKIVHGRRRRISWVVRRKWSFKYWEQVREEVLNRSYQTWCETSSTKYAPIVCLNFYTIRNLV